MLLAMAFVAMGVTSSPVRAFEDGNIAQAFRQAQVRLTLPNVPEESIRQAQLVTAVVYMLQGKMSQAVAAFDKVEAGGVALGAAADALRVRAAVESLDCGEAAQFAAKLPPDSVFAAPSWAQVTRCALRDQDKDRASYAFERMEQASANSGNLAESVNLRARVEALGGDVREDSITRTFLKEPTSLSAVELDITNQAYGAARMRLHTLLPRLLSPARRAHALYLRGDIAARRGHWQEALASFQQAMQDAPDQPFAWVAAVAASRVAYGHNDFELSQRCAHWMLAQPEVDIPITYIRDDGTRGTTSTSALRDEALWLLAWQAYRAHEPSEGIDSYLGLINPDGEFGLAALYWRARVAADMDDNEAASVFAQLVREHGPATFYGLLAVDLIHRVAPKDGLTLPMVLFPEQRGAAAMAMGPPAQPSDLKLAMLLYDNGFQNEARRQLRRLPIAAMAVNDRMVAAYMYREFGEVSTAALLSRRAVQTEPIAATLLELAYPRPFDSFVESAAKDSHVPAALIYAIMREESFFNPQATSGRKAMGLMQMLVPTAQSVAKAAHVRFSQKQLYQPKIAIRLGSFYLAQLLKQNHGDIVATVAAYQAGERNVSHWRVKGDTRAPEVFVEDVPYQSTRNYVKKVLSSYAFYRMHGGEPPSRAVQLFELPGMPFTTASADTPVSADRAAVRRR